MPYIDGKRRPSREPRQVMGMQDPKVRHRNFDEVALGFTEEQARAEADRCLQCKNPTCEQGCPVNVRIRDFIGGILDDDFCGGVAALRERNALPAVCGRVCTQETQCEAACVLSKKGTPVAIGGLERFLADWDRSREPGMRCKTVAAPRNGKRVAVIGSGPSGLACAGELSLLGYGVTVYESLHTAGGVLAYGIPEFRLPKSILQDEVEALRTARVEFKFDQVVGRITNAQELLDEQGFSAIFLGTGAGLPIFLGIPGENQNGVFSANEYLTRVNLMRAYDFPKTDTPVWRGNRVVVIGGGNVAMDSARTALRLGAAEVYLVYRRTEEEMPARIEERNHAKEEGVIFKELYAPLEVVGDQGWCTGLRVQRMRLGQPDASGRRSPMPIEGEESVIECDTVISAVGTRAHHLAGKISDVKMTDRGYVEADDDGRTSNPRIFAGGDIVTGAATVILAMGAGKKAAHAIDEYVKNRPTGAKV
ncbi:MAG: NADPH-dependent glutamate synthase [Coriobacteriia bacterium]|nr:NADPH-dependent glutamate synthase [Coriobacteriia bacterium]